MHTIEQLLHNVTIAQFELIMYTILLILALYARHQDKVMAEDEAPTTLPDPPTEVTITIPTKHERWHGCTMGYMGHIVGDGYTVFYGDAKGYMGGVFDARAYITVHGDGYSYHSGNLYSKHLDWYMFAS